MATSTLPSASGGSSLNPMSFTDNQGLIILERLRYQRANGFFCDAFVKVEGSIFAAHRAVLAASSPYFDAILKNNVVIKEQISVSCKNVAVFELMLDYIYTGLICIDRSTIIDLLNLSSNFMMLKLKSYCGEYLARHIDTANCLTIKELGEKHNMPVVIKAASDYFDININRCLLDSSAVLHFRIQQVKNIIKKYEKIITPDVHLRLVTRWASFAVDQRFRKMKALLRELDMSKVSKQVIDYVMEYSDVMKDQRARFILLHMAAQTSMILPKFTTEYTQLLESIGEGVLAEIEKEKEEEIGAAAIKAQELAKEADEVAVIGKKTAAQILAADKKPYTLTTKRAGAKLSTIARGAPPKKKGRPIGGADAAGPSRDVHIDEDHVDGVYILSEEATLYPDPSGMDPSTMDGKADSEWVTGGQAVCDFCSYASDDAEELQRHIAVRHDRNTVLVCTLCTAGFETRWAKAFYEHVAGHFGDTSLLTCDECGFSTKDGLQPFLNHRLMHKRAERPFKCLACGWSCATRTMLWSHELIHTGGSTCACDVCGRSFEKKESLDDHVLKHNDRRTHTCVECGWASKTESDLSSHRAVRHQLGVYTCHISGCEYVSIKKSQLAAHLRTHLAVRAHVCRICGRGFIEKSHVVRHERIHLDEKPFKCDQCEYASSRRDKLKEHILKYHNDAAGNTGQPVVKTVQRRKAQRAKEVMNAINKQKESRGLDVLFRPIESSREKIEQWHQGLSHGGHHNQMQAPRALSVVAPPTTHAHHPQPRAHPHGGSQSARRGGASGGGGGGLHNGAGPSTTAMMNHHQQQQQQQVQPLQQQQPMQQQQYPQYQYGHSQSVVHHGHNDHHPASPGSMSLMNMGGGRHDEDSPMFMDMIEGDAAGGGGGAEKHMNIHGLRLDDSPLVTPVPRSPHNHSDPFAMGNQDGTESRPMSLPPYGGGHNWYN